MAKVSIIIPVYNVEKYLRQCLESVVNQTLQDIEIIIVNDGSTDSSLSICEEFAKKDSRIKLISQKNGGLSAARNTGMKSVTGEYVGFVDSDDWVSLDFYEKLYESAKRNDCNIAASSAVRKYENREKYRFHYGAEIVAKSLKEKIKLSNIPKCCYVWNKLYKTDLVKNQPFTEGAFYEDVLWIPQILKAADKMVFVPETLYYYRANKNSIVKKRPTAKKQQDFYNAQKKLIAFFDENYLKLTDKQRTITKSKIYLGNLLILKIKEFQYTDKYFLFGFIPILRITKYPKVEVFNAES